MSRIAPASASSIEFEGLRHAQIVDGPSEGRHQRAGFLSITDLATGQRITVVKACPVTFDPRLEANLQTFFRRMTRDEASRQLLMENERSARMHVAIDGHAVKPAP